jgi:pimeloyl-ACP methyl ester carboxylesterase
MRSTVIVLCAAVLAVSGCTAQKGDPVIISSDHPDNSAGGARRLRATRLGGPSRCRRRRPGRGPRHGSGGRGALQPERPEPVRLAPVRQDARCAWLPGPVYDYGTAADPAGDVVNAAAKLRELGVRTVLLAGASQGAKASLIAAPGITPPVAGVVSLSAERTAHGQDVLPFVAKLKAPVLFITAKDDRYGAADATPQLYKAATKASSRRLEVLPGDAHGTDLLTGPNGAKVQAMIIDFLSKYDEAS